MPRNSDEDVLDGAERGCADEADRGPAETDRGPAEADRGPAETDRGPAEADRGPMEDVIHEELDESERRRLEEIVRRRLDDIERERLGHAERGRPGGAERRPVASSVRDACLAAAVTAYRDALMRGLCHDGAWECATGAIRSYDLGDILNCADGHTSR